MSGKRGRSRLPMNRRGATRRRPLLEGLESRCLLAVFTVMTTEDSGQSTLREAIEKANETPGQDSIVFAIPSRGDGTVQTIRPTTPFPAIIEPISINGRTQSSTSSLPSIELDGSLAGVGADGLHLKASNNRVEGLSIVGFQGSGIRIQNSHNNVIIANYIGVSSSSNLSRPNGNSGIFISHGSKNTIGGGGGAFPGNLISGNTGNGISIVGPDADGNRILSNLIGTNASGGSAIPNTGDGISISQASDTLVGGSESSQSNVISGNANHGVSVLDRSTSGTRILGNLIGVNGGSSISGGGPSAGSNAIPNGGAGIFVSFAKLTTIGGVVASSRNIISGNVGPGISFTVGDGATVLGNKIGTDATGQNDLGNQGAGIAIRSGTGIQIGSLAMGASNTIAWNGKKLDSGGVNITAGEQVSILSNSIFNNFGRGIVLFTADGQPPDNDPKDEDSGPNLFQNFPVLTAAITGGPSTAIRGTFNSTPNTRYTIQFFSTPTVNHPGFGEGQFLVGQIFLTTNDQGDAEIDQILTSTVSVGHAITATATDPQGNTSEFALARSVIAVNVANLSVAMTAIPSVLAGTPFDYQITVSNEGPNAATNINFVMSTPQGLTVEGASLPSLVSSTPGKVTGNLGTLAPSARLTFTITVRPTVVGQVLTTVDVNSDQIDLNLANNRDTKSTKVSLPVDLGLSLTSASPSATVGNEFILIATVTNHTRVGLETGEATQTILELTLPEGVNFVEASVVDPDATTLDGRKVTLPLGSIAKASSTTVRITLRAPLTLPDPAILTFSALVRSSEVEADEPPSADLHPNNATISVPLLPSSDLSLSFFGNRSQVLLDDTILFSYEVANSGPSPATNVKFANVLPLGLEFVSAPTPSQGLTRVETIDGLIKITALLGDIAAGGTASGTILVRARTSGLIVNTASIRGFEPDPSLDNNDVSVTTAVNPADLALSANPLPAWVEAGSPLTYTIVVTNRGIADASNVALVDTLPLGVIFQSASLSNGGIVLGLPAGEVVGATNRVLTANLGAIASGGRVTLTIVVIPVVSERIENRAIVKRDEYDPDPTNDSLVMITDVSPVDVGMELNAGSPTGAVGELVTVTARVTNYGPTKATGLQIRSLLPEGFRLASFTASQGSATVSGSTVIATLGDLSPGSWATITMVGVPLVGGSATFDASILRVDQFDTNSENDSASMFLLVSNSPGTLNFSSPTFSAVESSGEATITLTRSGGSLGAVTVTYSASAGSAAAGTNFTPLSGTISFADGEHTRSFRVPIRSDGLIRGDLTVYLSLSSPGGGAVLGSTSTATLVIQNTDRDVSGPVVVDVINRGAGRAMTGVSLVFDEDLDASSASDPANYRIYSSRRGVETLVPIASTVYDARTRTVNLAVAGRMLLNTFYRVVVNAESAGGIRDVLGNLVRGDGTSNARNFSASFARGSALQYSDRDGDLVSLKLSNGLIDLTRDANGEGLAIRVQGRGRKSVLTGNVRRGSVWSDGVSSFDTIIGAGFGGRVETRLTTPNFFVTDMTSSLRLIPHPGRIDSRAIASRSLIKARSLIR